MREELQDEIKQQTDREKDIIYIFRSEYGTKTKNKMRERERDGLRNVHNDRLCKYSHSCGVFFKHQTYLNSNISPCSNVRKLLCLVMAVSADSAIFPNT